MCGIVGSFKAGRTGSGADVVARMRDRMEHRGPDGAGIWCARDRSCTLGHRRLSIIDLSPKAAQPMVNDDGTVAVTFNGEIYNHMEIRQELEALGKYRWRTDHSDTEMLLHAYEEWGLDCVNRFYGMFAFIVRPSDFTVSSVHLSLRSTLMSPGLGSVPNSPSISTRFSAA